MSPSGFEIVRTREGAAAVRDRETGEVMHPVVGAEREVSLLYLEPSRLAQRLTEPGPPLVLFDVGLGAGAIAAAAWRLSESRPGGRRLEIVSFDRTLDALRLALEAPEAAELGLDESLASPARRLLDLGDVEGTLTRWRVVVGELPETLAETELSADVVAWDPFSPRANPELWTMGAFAALRTRVRHDATVHTYSAATATRTALLLAGFFVGRGPASGTKPETTEAAVRREDLTDPLGARFLDRLSRSSSPFPADAPEDALVRVAPLLTQRRT